MKNIIFATISSFAIVASAIVPDEKISQCVFDSSFMLKTTSKLALVDKILFIFKVNAAIDKFPGSDERKDKLLLDANFAAINATKNKSELTYVIAAIYSSMPIKSLEKLNDKLSNEIYFCIVEKHAFIDFNILEENIEESETKKQRVNLARQMVDSISAKHALLVNVTDPQLIDYMQMQRQILDQTNLTTRTYETSISTVANSDDGEIAGISRTPREGIKKSRSAQHEKIYVYEEPKPYWLQHL